MKRPLLHLLGLALIAASLAGCGASSDHALNLTLDALDTPVAKSTPYDEPTVKCNNATLTASLRPPATLPAPGHMPPSSFMADIRKKGHLVAGVNAGAYKFGALNPGSGNIEGFEIDLVNQIAKAIFGTAKGHVLLVALTVPQKIPFLEQGKVDIVVDTMTITCYRRTKVDFSAVYYDAQQRLLVPLGSGIKSISALAHKPVCATTGSNPIEVMKAMSPQTRPIPVGKSQAIDCLVAMQLGQVEGISTDSSILLGFKAQDPNTEIVGPSLKAVPYGMAINSSHRDFVQFVNGVLSKLERNGTWQQLQANWLRNFGQLESPPTPRYDG